MLGAAVALRDIARAQLLLQLNQAVLFAINPHTGQVTDHDIQISNLAGFLVQATQFSQQPSGTDLDIRLRDFQLGLNAANSGPQLVVCIATDQAPIRSGWRRYLGLQDRPPRTTCTHCHN